MLLLNASFEPLHVISWQRAVSLFFSDKVEIVEEYDHEIRSVSLAIKAPAVVRLLQYVKMGRRKPPFSRLNILARDLFRCQYCNTRLNSKDATLDHVVPRSKGGTTCWQNVVCSCRLCNTRKGSRSPQDAGMRLLKSPAQPDWLPVLKMKFNGQLPKSWRIFLSSRSH